MPRFKSRPSPAQMLLENEAVEGQNLKQTAEAERVFLLLKGHMRRMREQLGIQGEQQPQIEPVAVPPDFQRELVAVWERYLAIQKEPAADEFSHAQEALVSFESSSATVDDAGINEQSREIWQKEKANLEKLIGRFEQLT